MAKESKMMAKKKKDKSDDPKRTKASSSKKSSQERDAAAGRNAPFAASEFPVAPKPRRAATVRKKTAPEISMDEISADDIALRAYYIAEHRRNLSLPGDAVDDWVEAERQLRKESAKRAS